MKVALATASAAITPATLTAMVGMAKGGALQVAPVVTKAISAMQTHAFSLTGSIPALSTELGNAAVGASGLTASHLTTALSNLSSNPNISPSVISSITSLIAPGGAIMNTLGASSALSDLSSKLLPAGNPAAFGAMLQQAHGHIADSVELTKATNFMSNISFGDFGAGITDMSSMTTQGIDGVMGDLGAAAKAFEAAGPVFDLNKIGSLGSSTGLVDKLNSVKLGNASGVNAAIAAAGLDMTNPEHAPAISKIVSSIKDPAIIATIQDQLKISPGGIMGSVNDFTDLSKLAPAGSGLLDSIKTGMVPKLPVPAGLIPTAGPVDDSMLNSISGQIPSAGLTTDLKGMASKLSDMGAKFPSASSAASLLGGIQIPHIPALNLAVPSLSGLMSSLAPDLKAMTGLPAGVLGSGQLGCPSMTDFTSAVSGGPAIANLLAESKSPGGISQAALDNINSMVTKSTTLFASAGVDINTPLPASLGSIMGFATSLHKLGADKTGSGTAGVLATMATDDQYGQAVKASMAEGKNKELLAQAGIAPLPTTPSEPTPVVATISDDLEVEYRHYQQLSNDELVLADKMVYVNHIVNMLPDMVTYWETHRDSMGLVDTDKVQLQRKRIKVYNERQRLVQADMDKGIISYPPN
jgi:hypothetical protein